MQSQIATSVQFLFANAMAPTPGEKTEKAAGIRHIKCLKQFELSLLHVRELHDATAHAHWRGCIHSRPIRPTCNGVEIEVILAWIGGNIANSLREAGALVFSWDEVAHHTCIVRGSHHVRRAGLRVWASCIDQARRVAATEADHWWTAAVLPVAVRCVMNVRCDERRLTTVYEGGVGDQGTVGAQLESSKSFSVAVRVVREALHQIIKGHRAKESKATAVGALVL